MTSANVSLVPIADDEHDDFFAMFGKYYLELSKYEDDPEGVDEHLRYYRPAMLADMEGRELYWIAVDGDWGGFIVVRYLPDWPREERMIASIAEFYVLPDYRRGGVGAAAVEALLAEHRDRGTYLVEADILVRNEPAKAFWARLGFETQFLQTGRRP